MNRLRELLEGGFHMEFSFDEINPEVLKIALGERLFKQYMKSRGESMSNLDDEIFDLAYQEGKSVQECLYDIYDKGRASVFAELKSLLRCRNYRGCAAGKGCDGVCRIDSDICRNCENFGIPYSLLTERLKGAEE